PPTTAYDRLRPPATACNRLQPPTTAYNRLQPPATACTACRLYSRIGFSTYSPTLSCNIVRVHYFCERRFRWLPLPCKFKASLLSHLPVGSLDSSGVKQGLRWIEIARVGVESTKKKPTPDVVVVSRRDVTRRTTAQQVANQFLPASGKQISRKTVARRLRGGGLYARRPVVCVPLTRQHHTARLQWCREHHNWTEQDWACVLFSDESRFSLS
ncbi:hypothetical protein TNCV_3751361, partial [Trichonephila clavipes]